MNLFEILTEGNKGHIPLKRWIGQRVPDGISDAWYRGAGPHAMWKAAAAWRKLAVSLRECEKDLGRAFSEFQGSGASIDAILVAVAAYREWLRTTVHAVDASFVAGFAAARAFESAKKSIPSSEELRDFTRSLKEAQEKGCWTGMKLPQTRELEHRYFLIKERSVTAVYVYVTKAMKVARKNVAGELIPFTKPPMIAAEPAGSLLRR